MDKVYDLIILGAGPGGLAAGIYAGRAELDTLILEREFAGGEAARTDALVNYPGFGPGTKGPDLTQQMYEHCLAFGAEVVIDDAQQMELQEPIKVVKTRKGETYRARAVILALGSEPRKLNVPGEEEFHGCGVSYCATCDGAFFKNQEVVVVGSGDSAVNGALFLTRFATKVKIVVSHNEGSLVANRQAVAQAVANSKIEWYWNKKVNAIYGDDKVKGVVLQDLKTGREEKLAAGGVFCLIGSRPRTDELRWVLSLSESGHIVTNDLMETNIPGVYAVGDVRAKYLRQVVTAAADGAIAATAASDYLAKEKVLYDLREHELALIVFWQPRAEDAEVLAQSIEMKAEEKYGPLFKVRKSSSQNALLRKELGIKENEYFAGVVLRSGKPAEHFYS